MERSLVWVTSENGDMRLLAEPRRFWLRGLWKICQQFLRSYTSNKQKCSLYMLGHVKTNWLNRSRLMSDPWGTPVFTQRGMIACCCLARAWTSRQFVVLRFNMEYLKACSIFVWFFVSKAFTARRRSSRKRSMKSSWDGMTAFIDLTCFNLWQNKCFKLIVHHL